MPKYTTNVDSVYKTNSISFTEKHCSKCKKVKPLSAFAKNSYAKSGFNSQCKECKNARERDLRKLPEIKKKESIASAISYKKRKALGIHRRKKRREDVKFSFSGPGFIYVLEWSNFFKIGRAIKPHERVKKINKSLPFEGNLICIIPTSNMAHSELMLHDKFSTSRQGGEWFLLSKENIQYILELELDK